ncbi:MAG TPA: PEP-CTERM sorting domain-containing protein [Candidatus Paceibacterota bacterium]|nr:PEP-CTERM sorting domain-containing protein [Verrucomicrobiota bacterium]HOX03447.1 PEP-CTERM sorting domain-containing protein [Verrucomicrobiota bacterium]HRZ47195.1 PEP-CTERM sorting domain-containing protein [Candidatus Paceibacterota bacterium]HRZ93632.1 PEP-CTERM sorting domain-containing protein [Candidatus Paceibacterota bacterium]
MKTKSALSLLSALAMSLGTSHATITWIGGSSADFWDDANWSFAASTYTGDTFNPLTYISDNIFMANATGVSVAADNGIRIGNGYGLTLDGSDLLVNGTAASSGVNGVDDDPAANPSVGQYSFVYLKNGSYLNTQFTAIGMFIDVDGTSHVQYRGTGDPINGQSERTVVDLAVGGRLTLATMGEFTEQATTQNSYLLIEGNSWADDSSLLTFGGSGPFTATAVVPEPSIVLLGGLGLAGLLLRRRA